MSAERTLYLDSSALVKLVQEGGRIACGLSGAPG